MTEQEENREEILRPAAIVEQDLDPAIHEVNYS